MIRVLLVDDELPVHETFEFIINWNELGFEKPDNAYDAQSALDLMLKNRYDVVITDICMPEMSGIDLMNSLRELNINVFFVVITGYDYINYAQQAIRCGVMDYLLKPIDRHELTETLQRIAKQHDLSRGNFGHEVGYIQEEKSVYEKTCFIIDNSFKQNLSVTKIAHELCIHPGYLGQLFRKLSGMTITDYINRQRIEWIKQNINIGRTPSNEIIREAGYINANYFYRKFLELEGKTFPEWKKDKLEEESNVHEE